jgi:hypothetical protein
VVLGNICVRAGLNINTAGIPEGKADREINLTPYDMRLANIIKHVLRQVNSANENDDANLTYVVNDQGIVNFVTKESLKKDETVETRVHDINDLVVSALDANLMPTSILGSKGTIYKKDLGGEITPIDDIVRQTLPKDFDETLNPGGVKYDDGAKKLIIKGTADQQDRVARLLDKLRALQTMQVSVSAHYLKLSDDFWEQFKSEFYDYNSPRPDGNTTLAPQKTVTNNTVGIFSDQGSLANHYSSSHNANDSVRASLYNSNFSGFTSVFGSGATPDNFNNTGLLVGLQTRGVLGELQANWFLQMVRQNKRNDELFAPHLVVFNNRYGWIRFITQLPFISTWKSDDSGGDTTAMRPIFSTVDDGCSLEVEPNISPDCKYVTLRTVPRIIKVEKFTNADIKRIVTIGQTGQPCYR